MANIVKQQFFLYSLQKFSMLQQLTSHPSFSNIPDFLDDPSPHRVLNLKYRNKCKRNTVYPLCITGTQIEVYLSQRHEY